MLSRPKHLLEEDAFYEGVALLGKIRDVGVGALRGARSVYFTARVHRGEAVVVVAVVEVGSLTVVSSLSRGLCIPPRVRDGGTATSTSADGGRPRLRGARARDVRGGAVVEALVDVTLDKVVVDAHVNLLERLLELVDVTAFKVHAAEVESNFLVVGLRRVHVSQLDKLLRDSQELLIVLVVEDGFGVADDVVDVASPTLELVGRRRGAELVVAAREHLRLADDAAGLLVARLCVGGKEGAHIAVRPGGKLWIVQCGTLAKLSSSLMTLISKKYPVTNVECLTFYPSIG